MRNHRSRGFTLIEIMIAVLIIGVLGAIALTSYQRSVVETRRKAATTCLLEAAQRLERFHTTRMTYVGADLAGVQCRNDLATFYTIDIEAGSLAQRTFRVQAVAVGRQADLDAACGTLVLDQLGQRFVNTTPGGGACW